MNSYELSFGTIIVLKIDLAEVIINEGVVMDELMVVEYHNFLLSYLKKPFSLLINKKYTYTYTFSAQKKIANLKEMQAMAVLVSNNGGFISTENIIKLDKGNNWNIKLFKSRDKALSWLEKY